MFWTNLRAIPLLTVLAVPVWTAPQQNNLAAEDTGDRRAAFTADGVTNAASYATGAVAPGEIIVIFGTGLGPDDLTTLEVQGEKVTTSLAETRVLFDGIPAALIYVWNEQVSVVVPYAVANQQTTDIQIEYQGVLSDPVTVPVAPVAPGCFSLDSSGTGQAAMLNQDGTVNSPENPAAQGSIVAIFCTGEGQTDPPGVDGQVALHVYPKPLAGIRGNIAWFFPPVHYAGAAPEAVAGVLQVNMTVPTGLNGGPNVPVKITAGGVESQDGLTMSIVQLSGGALAPGMTLELAGTTSAQNSELPGSVSADNIRQFQITDSQGSPILSGEIQDRILTSTATGNIIGMPQIENLDDHGTGAGIVALDVGGYAAISIKDANYRTDGHGDQGPVSVTRSADGATLSFVYDPPLVPPNSSYFLTIFTESTTFGQTGQLTVYAKLPGSETLYSAVITETNAPQ